MKSPIQYDKIELIRRSLRCFGFGLFGLVPGVGIPFAIVALSEYSQVFRHKGSTWNPAERYLGIGTICATVGSLLTIVLVFAIVIEIG